MNSVTSVNSDNSVNSVTSVNSQWQYSKNQRIARDKHTFRNANTANAINYKVQSVYSMDTSKLVKRQICTMLKDNQGGRWILTEYSWMGSTMTGVVYKVS